MEKQMQIQGQIKCLLDEFAWAKDIITFLIGQFDLIMGQIEF
jgi:hypothetical protein